MRWWAMAILSKLVRAVQAVSNMALIIERYHRIGYSFLYSRQHNNLTNNSPSHLCLLRLFRLRYNYATCFGYHGAIVR
jgi:hypothetical protein